MIAVIDNYDSFTYNLVQYLGELGQQLMIFRNDAVSVAELQQLHPDRIVISPGPGTPCQAGISLQVIQQLGPSIPILGVCLGHQAIAEAFGGQVIRARQVMHGKTSTVYHDGKGVYRNMPARFTAMRYHSLQADPDSLPTCLQVSSHTADGVIMGLRHRHYAIEGVQFHPESMFTEQGKTLLNNFIQGV